MQHTSANNNNNNNTNSSSNNIYDDENADYIVHPGEVFLERFSVIEILGKGSFGQVIKAYDKLQDEMVAIKIIKNKTPFYNQALIEISILKHMNKKDPEEKYFIGNHS